MLTSAELLVIDSFRANLREIWMKNTFLLQDNPFENVPCEMTSTFSSHDMLIWSYLFSSVRLITEDNTPFIPNNNIWPLRIIIVGNNKENDTDYNACFSYIILIIHQHLCYHNVASLCCRVKLWYAPLTVRSVFIWFHCIGQSPTRLEFVGTAHIGLAAYVCCCH